MTTLFTRIITGEIPARFVWRDDRCVAFLTIAPLAPGHTLVVPVDEYDHWIDLPFDLLAHLMGTAQVIARAQQAVFRPTKVGVLVVGEEVPHTHVHLVPFTRLDQLDLGNAEADPSPETLDEAAERLRAGLRADGASGVTD